VIVYPLELATALTTGAFFSVGAIAASGPVSPALSVSVA